MSYKRFSSEDRLFGELAMAVFTSQIRGTDSVTVATVPVSEHCSNFLFFSVKNCSKID
jgi:hypothetical protein